MKTYKTISMFDFFNYSYLTAGNGTAESRLQTSLCNFYSLRDRLEMIILTHSNLHLIYDIPEGNNFEKLAFTELLFLKL